jgi:hypothetical protein
MKRIDVDPRPPAGAVAPRGTVTFLRTRPATGGVQSATRSGVRADFARVPARIDDCSHVTPEAVRAY